MTTIQLRVAGIPAPQGSKRIARGRLIESNKNVAPWRKAVTAAAEYDRSMRRNPEALTGPIGVYMAFYLPRPRNHYRTGKFADQLRRDAPDYCHTKPDGDKLARAINDSLTKAGIWLDDSQVARLIITKHFSDNPGVHIHITQLEQGRTL